MVRTHVEVYEGNLKSREVLENLINANEDINEQLRPIIKNLDIFLENNHMDLEWWYTTLNEIPTGIIVVNSSIKSLSSYTNSHLFFFWADRFSDEIYEASTIELFKAWQRNDFDTYIVEVAINSDLIEIIERLHFKFELKILNVYLVETTFQVVEETEFFLRKPKIHELSWIYDEILSKNLKSNSPIYLTKEQFLGLASVENSMENWLVATDELNNIVGFGGSPPWLKKFGNPILYGPYSNFPEINLQMIAEFITHWKMQGADKLNILRTSPLQSEIMDELQIVEQENHSINRYIYFKT